MRDQQKITAAGKEAWQKESNERKDGRNVKKKVNKKTLRNQTAEENKK